MNNTYKPSERIAVVGVIDPDANAAGTYVTGWVPASRFFSYMVLVMAGTLGASATLDAKIEQATDADGADAKDITGAAITQLTQAGSDSDKQAIINLRTEKLDVDGGFGYIRLSMTVGTATSDCGAVLLGVDGRNEPASDFDTSTVDEIVG